MHDKHGKVEIWRGQPLPRAANVPTPCETCPRKSPENEAATTLTDQNWKAYGYYQEVQATCGACLDDRQKKDKLSRGLLRIIHQIVKENDQRELAQTMAFAALTAGHR